MCWLHYSPPSDEEGGTKLFFFRVFLLQLGATWYCRRQRSVPSVGGLCRIVAEGTSCPERIGRSEPELVGQNCTGTAVAVG